MARANVAQQNFAGGELSPKLRGRWELPIYRSGCEKMLNFIAETQGPAKFRTGGRFVHTTRRNNIARLEDFQFNDEQAYVLEFTDKFVRFFKDEAIIVEGDVTITGISNANPAVVTATAHGYSSGDEVFIFDVVGMTEVNGKSFIVGVTAANTFELQDQDEVDVDSTLFTAYSSAGIAQKIVEVASPYLERHLFDLKFSQNADVNYITHPFYEPRKLTRTSNIAWTLNIFTRTADPFTDQKTITAITQANPGVVTSTAHGYANGDIVIIETVVGMTEVNGGIFIVANQAANTFELTDIDGVNVDTSGFTAYGSAGYATDQNLLPGSSAFYEGRLFYARNDLQPDTFWGSRSPTDVGVVRYDDFTTGTDADHSIKNTLASKEGNVIFWLAPTDRLLAIGTFGSTFKATGATADEAITPTNINVRPVDFVGAASIEPVFQENILIYVQRGGLTIRSFEFDTLNESYISVDRNLVADHITEGGVKQITFQTGRPDLFWAIKNDGTLLGLTFKSREDVSGWHRHETSGTDAKYISLAIMFQENNFDQLWYVAERTIDGVTRRYVEFLEDEPVIPEVNDFFTGRGNELADDLVFRNAMFEAQKDYVHLDAVLTYDGTAPGSAAGATMSLAAATGTGIIFTASAAVFTLVNDVGREIWKKAIDGVGTGRATITAVNSTTEVVCTVVVDFDNTDVMAAGNWYLTTDSITGVDHLEGEDVGVVTDGSIHPDDTVVNGAISLDYQASKVHIGLEYPGFIKTMSIEVAATIGPAQGKPMNVDEVIIRFYQTLGASFGTDLYNMEDILFRSSEDFTNRPPPLFSGDKPLHFSDDWAEGKHIYVQQLQPLPCVVQLINPFITTSNE